MRIGSSSIMAPRARLLPSFVDPGSAPQRVGEAHVADQLAGFAWYFRSAAARTALPSPEQAKTSAMPADDRLRFDDHQGVGCDPIEARKNEAIEIAASALFFAAHGAGGEASGSPPRERLATGKTR